MSNENVQLGDRPFNDFFPQKRESAHQLLTVLVITEKNHTMWIRDNFLCSID